MTKEEQSRTDQDFDSDWLIVEKVGARMNSCKICADCMTSKFLVHYDKGKDGIKC